MGSFLVFGHSGPTLMQFYCSSRNVYFTETDVYQGISAITLIFYYFLRCGNVAAILELDEHLQREFIIFEAAPQETRGIPSKKPVADYFL